MQIYFNLNCRFIINYIYGYNNYSKVSNLTGVDRKTLASWWGKIKKSFINEQNSRPKLSFEKFKGVFLGTILVLACGPNSTANNSNWPYSAMACHFCEFPSTRVITLIF
jgi:hypothetical protein